MGCNWVLVKVTTAGTISVKVTSTNPYTYGRDTGADSLN